MAKFVFLPLENDSSACFDVSSNLFVVYGTKCSSRVGERQGQLAGTAGGQAGAVVLRKETKLWDS